MMVSLKMMKASRNLDALESGDRKKLKPSNEDSLVRFEVSVYDAVVVKVL